MKSQLAGELRKLFTVRSTYIMTALGLLIVVVTAFWVEGYKGISGSPAANLESNAVEEIIKNTALSGGGFGVIIAILFMAHEYRYNTIMYTLTASNSRHKVLASKIIVMLGFGIALTFTSIVVGLALYDLGLSFRDATLPTQEVNWPYMGGRILFYNLAQMMLGLILATLTRSITAAIAIVFLAPATIEPLLGLLLKEKAAYLPYASLERVISAFGGEAAQIVSGTLSVGRAVFVASTYIIIGWIITWYLFIRRDAN
jgi:ABC-type transport system involved in multi-copper enzyme maturation permease subunit